MKHQELSEELAPNDLNDSKNKSKRKSPLELRRYTTQIWLAGLGAFSRAEEEGNKLFDSLVQMGEELEARTTDIADNTAGKVGGVTTKAIGRVSDTVDKVEKLIDQGTHQALSRIGLTKPKDIMLIEQLLTNMNDKLDSLIESNQKLQEEIEQLKVVKK